MTDHWPFMGAARRASGASTGQGHRAAGPSQSGPAVTPGRGMRPHPAPPDRPRPARCRGRQRDRAMTPQQGPDSSFGHRAKHDARLPPSPRGYEESTPDDVAGSGARKWQRLPFRGGIGSQRRGRLLAPWKRSTAQPPGRSERVASRLRASRAVRTRCPKWMRSIAGAAPDVGGTCGRSVSGSHSVPIDRPASFSPSQAAQPNPNASSAT